MSVKTLILTFHSVNVFVIDHLDHTILLSYSLACMFASFLLLRPLQNGNSTYVLPFLVLTVPINIALIGIFIKSCLDKSPYVASGLGLVILVSLEGWFCMLMHYTELKIEERKARDGRFIEKEHRKTIEFEIFQNTLKK